MVRLYTPNFIWTIKCVESEQKHSRDLNWRCFVLIYLWKDDETDQNQRIPAVMLKLKLIPPSSRTGSVLNICENAGERASLCVLLMLFGSLDDRSWHSPPHHFLQTRTWTRTEPALIRTGSGKTTAFTNFHSSGPVLGGRRWSWWTWYDRTKPKKRESAADWSQFLFLFGFEGVCVKATQT